MTIRKAKMPTSREKDLKKRITCVLSVPVSGDVVGFMQIFAVSSGGRGNRAAPLSLAVADIP